MVLDDLPLSNSLETGDDDISSTSPESHMMAHSTATELLDTVLHPKGGTTQNPIPMQHHSNLHPLVSPPLSIPPAPHNLIPLHLQLRTMEQNFYQGTPGYQPALIPSCHGSTELILQQPQPQQQPEINILTMTQTAFPSSLIHVPQILLTVQDRPLIPPVYNGVNPHYPGLQMIHSNPPIFTVQNFLTPFECQFLIHAASDSFGPAPVVGPGSGEISPSRTSSTCYLAREDLPDYLRKVSLLTGKPVEHCELPQVGRYLPSQQYLQHLDAFDLSHEDGRRFAANGGQRTVTVLVYLNDVLRGGATYFPILNVTIQPKQGMAVVFFPATIDGFMDTMALHAALPAIDTKYVSQVWIRQGPYIGQASKRLHNILGAPFVTQYV
jgi:prolyl 4-hydroxylase